MYTTVGQCRDKRIRGLRPSSLSRRRPVQPFIVFTAPALRRRKAMSMDPCA